MVQAVRVGSVERENHSWTGLLLAPEAAFAFMLMVRLEPQCTQSETLFGKADFCPLAFPLAFGIYNPPRPPPTPLAFVLLLLVECTILMQSTYTTQPG